MAAASSSHSSKGKGINASSFLTLRAEIAKHEEEFAKNKAAGKAKAVVGGVKRPGKKPTIWAKQNKGVQGRASRDIELEEISKPTLETARAILERKAAVYDKLAKGKSGGLSDKQFESLLVDFDSKPTGNWESDSDDVDESLTVPKAPHYDDDLVVDYEDEFGRQRPVPRVTDDNDPVIEYDDEFGRQRTGRRSEVPRHLLPPGPDEKPPEEDIDPFVIYNPVNHFPVYEPSAERIASIQAEYAEDNNPLNVHYDASHEVRAKGAGFYQFSGDLETRRKQMEALKNAREETEKTREEMGAVDLPPGGFEGVGVSEESGSTKKSRAMEKRKREIEERRKLLDAKRQKKNPSPTEPTATSSQSKPPPSPPVITLANDPLALLESQVSLRTGQTKVRRSSPITAADDFLAALERDMTKGAR